MEPIHRTVRDFLVADAVHDDLRHKAGPGYNANVAILKGFAYRFRSLLSGASSIEDADNTLTLYDKDGGGNDLCCRYHRGTVPAVRWHHPVGASTAVRGSRVLLLRTYSLAR